MINIVVVIMPETHFCYQRVSEELAHYLGPLHWPSALLQQPSLPGVLYFVSIAM
jgi:hypothetical protein